MGAGPDAARKVSVLTVLPLYLAMAIAVGFVDHHVRAYPADAYTKHVPEVMTGQAPPPGRYRVLAPAVYDWMTRVTGSQPENSWLVFRFLCLVAAFSAGHVLYRTWLPASGAVAGNAIVATLLPLTFTNSVPQPDHLMELVLFTLGCACIARGWRTSFLIVLALAALNRETAFLLVIVFAGVERLSARGVRWIAAAVLTWAVVYVGLRWRLGFVAYDAWEFGNTWKRMFRWPVEAYQRDLYYRIYGWFFIVLIAGPLVAIARTWSAQPHFVRAAVGLALPIFVVIGVTFSSVMEPRIFTPLLPILAAGVMVGLTPDRLARTD